MEKGLRPIATRVLFEDDEVRVWDQEIGPGETVGRHRHDCDYVIVTVQGGGPTEVVFHDGTGGALGDSITLPEGRRGDTVFVPRGHVETAHNRGGRFRAILVELKKGGA
jgi:quercetin dioxygenase-like cupin family protein